MKTAPVLPEVSARRNASLGFAGVKPKITPQSSAREGRDITDPVKSAPGGAPEREVPSVDGAPRRAQASAPAPVPRKEASLGERGGSPIRETPR